MDLVRKFRWTLEGILDSSTIKFVTIDYLNKQLNICSNINENVIDILHNISSKNFINDLILITYTGKGKPICKEKFFNISIAGDCCVVYDYEDCNIATVNIIMDFSRVEKI